MSVKHTSNKELSRYLSKDISILDEFPNISITDKDDSTVYDNKKFDRVKMDFKRPSHKPEIKLKDIYDFPIDKNTL